MPQLTLYAMVPPTLLLIARNLFPKDVFHLLPYFDEPILQTREPTKYHSTKELRYEEIHL